jgi:hypothetical protein
MFTANKIYGKYQTGNDFFRIKKKMKSELSRDSVKQDINLVWPNIQIMLKKESFSVVTCANCITANNFNIK